MSLLKFLGAALYDFAWTALIVLAVAFAAVILIGLVLAIMYP